MHLRAIWNERAREDNLPFTPNLSGSSAPPPSETLGENTKSTGDLYDLRRCGIAQDDHKIAGTIDYSYVHANPQNNNIIPTFSLNGGGGSIAYYFTKLIGIEGEFEGYGSYTHNFTVPPPYRNGPCAVSAQGNLFTYNVGPIVKFRLSHFEPFVETLFGGAHSNFYRNLYTACTGSGCLIASKSPSNNAFDFLIGGGIDIPVNEHIAIRPAQFEYLLTRFGNDFTKGNNNQSNFRYQAGVQFRF